MTSEYDRKRDILNEGQLVTIYHAKEREKEEQDYTPTVTVPRQSLLDLVRHIDIGARVDPDRFAHSFDDLRAAFSEREISSGIANQPNLKRK